MTDFPKIDFDALCPTSKAELGNRMIQTVNARDLHRALEVGRDFSNWIKDRIEEYGFVENQDYVRFTPKLAKTSQGGRPPIDYHVTFDMAKELGMVERTPVGRAIRLYFIRKEEEARSRFVDDHVQAKLALYLAEEIRPWQKVFPDQLWQEFARLTGHELKGSQRPMYWGNLVNEFIYGFLDEDVKNWLKENARSSRYKRFHQRFNEDFGLHRLVSHIGVVVGTARNSFSISDLRNRLELQFSNKPAQLSFFIPLPAAQQSSKGAN
ncbi:AntA/AntB antirepressor domain protein [Solidesulfovibrio carbinoliphilus subsp. oakridgensis]|uniref:AntA/AntB antirepressor domain protein n=1 Tax=Solidesulfovibrio carbinoliphilus subsp. oakridgensis TaxID=694327 RepID=G7QCA7_9BACT|nr:antA/AntB antirepressor family protein [Solidesulfovibrio carbinoliphilus]EHJ49553.1 AntA/AntB antirepressor domain protein [Solidesulfovibrio carbinoliphilus subsp. oakridgensis]